MADTPLSESIQPVEVLDPVELIEVDGDGPEPPADWGTNGEGSEEPGDDLTDQADDVDTDVDTNDDTDIHVDTGSGAETTGGAV